MGMDLSGEGGYLRCGPYVWQRLLDLGCVYGWTPQGTLAPDFGPDYAPVTDWHGGYCTNDYQTVTAEDASNLANAVESALPDIPNRRVLPKELSAVKRIPQRDPRIRGPEGRDGFGPTMYMYPLPDDSWEHGPRPNLLQFWSGSGKKHLNEFIAFFRAGEFVIG